MLPNAVKKVKYKNVRDIDITSAKAKKKKLAQAGNQTPYYNVLKPQLDIGRLKLLICMSLQTVKQVIILPVWFLCGSKWGKISFYLDQRKCHKVKTWVTAIKRQSRKHPMTLFLERS
jgi:hypothetical protein